MGDRHKNFEDPITWTQGIRKTKFHLVRFFFTHPLQRTTPWPRAELERKVNCKKMFAGRKVKVNPGTGLKNHVVRRPGGMGGPKIIFIIYPLKIR
jgi:hypothetical protein